MVSRSIHTDIFGFLDGITATDVPHDAEVTRMIYTGTKFLSHRRSNQNVIPYYES